MVEEFRLNTEHVTFCRTSAIYCSNPLSFLVYLHIKSDDGNKPSLHSRNSCFSALKVIALQKHKSFMKPLYMFLMFTSGGCGLVLHWLTDFFRVFFSLVFVEFRLCCHERCRTASLSTSLPHGRLRPSLKPPVNLQIPTLLSELTKKHKKMNLT